MRTTPTNPSTPARAGDDEAPERDATPLQSPVAGQSQPIEQPQPPGDDGGTRTQKGSNYGDWVPDKREPDHPDIRHPEKMPLTPPPEGTSPVQGAFGRGDDGPRAT